MPMRPVAVRNVFDKKRALPRMVSVDLHAYIHSEADQTELGAREPIQLMATYILRWIVDT